MNIAIIVAGGSGKRMNNRVNKILLLLDKDPIIYHTIKHFEESEKIDGIILVVNKDDIEEINNLIKRYDFKKIKKVIGGGEKRQDSVYNGIKAIENVKEEDIVLIHNAANPFITSSLIEEVIKNTKDFGGCAVAVKAKDTVKEVNDDNFVLRTLDRTKLWQMQTPQASRYKLLVRAFVEAYNNNYYGTDDVELIERLGEKVKIIECSEENFKITKPIDLENAKLLMNADRVGIGLDSHKFSETPKKLVLGTVLIPDENGLEANSDGDVILHSLFNALSQSVGGKSLGFYADPLCKKGVKDSAVYLKIALEMVKEKGFKINNIGIMIEAKKPRLDKYEELIKENIAELCNVEHTQVGLTVTSGEELTDFGKGLGMQVFSVVSLGKE